MDYGKIPCDLCSETFSRRNKFETHYKNLHQLNPYPCIFCNKRFPRQKNLKAHHLCHQNKQAHFCEECNESFSHRNGLLWHRKKKHGFTWKIKQPSKKVKCKELDKNLSKHDGIPDAGSSKVSVTNFGVHELSHVKKQLFVCFMCNEGFSDEQDLDKHYLMHEPKNGKGHACKFCDKSFSEQIHLNVHLLSHAGHTSVPEIRHSSIKVSGQNKMRFQCIVCCKGFFSKSEAFAHSVTHSFKCHTCKETFSNKFDFYLHSASHKSKEDFSNQTDMCVTHTDNNTSTALKVYRCPFCNEHFSKFVDLRVHSLSHSNVTLVMAPIEPKEHQCLVCNELFSNQADLRVHGLSHAKIFTCEVCNETFINAVDFKVHSFSHSNRPST